jgi:release factor glutamine methyltransferase
MPHDPSQVYPPAEDTLLLLDAARQEVRHNDRVLEVGTGSGLIARELAPSARVVIATEINPHAARTARDGGVSVVRTDLFACIRGPFDLILFNPPYLPTQPEERLDDWLEYALDGGENGRDTIARFLADAGRVLAPGGRILLLISSLTGVSEVTGLARSRGYLAEVVREQPVEDERLYVILLKKAGN